MSVTYLSGEHYAMPTLAALARPVIGEEGYNARSTAGVYLPAGARVDFTPNLALPAGMTARLAVVYLGVAVPAGDDVEDSVTVRSAPGSGDAGLRWWGYPQPASARARLRAVTVEASFNTPIAQAHVFVTTSLKVFAARAVFTATSF